MNILSKEAILSADDLPREIVSVPEWGGQVYVRTMTAPTATPLSQPDHEGFKHLV